MDSEWGAGAGAPPGPGGGAERYVVAVDLGTSGAKVAIATTSGRIVAHDSEPVALLLGAGGAAEQDPESWYGAIRAAVHRLLARGVAPVAAIEAISVTAQWMGTVAVDSAGRAVGNAIIWMDSRGAPYSRRITGGHPHAPGTGYNALKLRRWVRATGGLPSRTGKDPVGHILWLMHERPEIYRSARTFLDVPDFLNLRLTGRACAAFDTAVGFWCTDNRDLTRVRYDEELVRLCRLDPATLPELVPTGSVIGYLTPAVAHDLGLGEPGRQVRVVTATGDTSSAAIGAGAVGDFDAHLYIGTSSWLTCPVPFKKTDIRTNITSLPMGIPGRWWAAAEQDVAGRALLWAIDVLGLGERGLHPFDELHLLAAGAAPGCGGAVFAPWLNGERTPVDDPDTRGVWLGLDLRTSRADMARSVLEGVALNTRWMLQSVERFVRRARPGGFPHVTFVGGGARSDLWCQILADVLDRPIRQTADPLLGNVRGAALSAAVALGHLRWEDVPGAVTVAATYEPDHTNRAVYDERYRTLVEAYGANKRLFARRAGHP
jgi:xylulokinase